MLHHQDSQPTVVTDCLQMSGVLGTMAYTNYFMVEGSWRQGGITAAMPAGSFFGALASSFVADKLSRKTAIQIAGLIWILGSMYEIDLEYWDKANAFTASRLLQMVLPSWLSAVSLLVLVSVSPRLSSRSTKPKSLPRKFVVVSYPFNSGPSLGVS